MYLINRFALPNGVTSGVPLEKMGVETNALKQNGVKIEIRVVVVFFVLAGSVRRAINV